MRTIKIYQAKASDFPKSDKLRVLAQYPAFVLAEAEEKEAERIRRDYLIEDISDQFRIENEETKLDTGRPRFAVSGARLEHPDYPERAELPSGPHHYVVQFIGPIKDSWRTKLRKTGAQIVAPYDGFAVVARIGETDLPKVAALKEVRWMGHLPYSARLSPQLARPIEAGTPAADPGTPRTRYLPKTFVVQFFQPERAARAGAEVRKAGFQIVEKPGDASNSLIVRTRSGDDANISAALERLARVHGVQKISARPIRRTSNDRAAVIMKTAGAMGAAPGLGLSGQGEIIGICDTGLDNGDPQTIHPDFSGRIVALKSYKISPDFAAWIKNPGADDGPSDLDSGHGTHTSGSIVGDGTGSSNLSGLAGPVRGLAYKAKLVMQAVEQAVDWKDPADLQEYGRYLLAGIPADLTTLFDYAYSKGARIHSNSWGGGDPGSYDQQCQQVDAYVWRKRNFCILFSAGNDGRDGGGSGTIDEGSVTPPGTAKNCITVGACENNRPQIASTYGGSWPQDYPVPPISADRLADNPDQVVAFSSRGPTGDGRIKPDVVAPGTYILSTRSRQLAPNNFGYGKFGSSSLYMFDSGTSMATPLTAGAVALIREYLRKKKGIASPSAALLKACVIACAAPLPTQASVPDNHQGFGRIALDDLLAPKTPMKARFVEGSGLRTGLAAQHGFTVATAGRPLKLVLVHTDFPGPRLVNNLNLLVTGPDGKTRVGNGKGVGGSFDAANNVETVAIAAAAAGNYSVQVIGANVPNGPQPYALVVVGALS